MSSLQMVIPSQLGHENTDGPVVADFIVAQPLHLDLSSDYVSTIFFLLQALICAHLFSAVMGPLARE